MGMRAMFSQPRRHGVIYKIQDLQCHLEFMKSIFAIFPNQEMKYYMWWWDALNTVILKRSLVRGESVALLATGVGFDDSLHI